MKTFKAHTLIIILLGMMAFNSCVDDDDFDTPNTEVVEPDLDGPEVSIGAIAGQLAQEQGNTELDYTDESTVLTFDFNETNQYLVGYVVSSDEAGNYFEEIILQDRPESPTTGIKVLIDVNPLFGRYGIGRKLYIKLNGLAVGITNGVLSVGALNGNEVDKIPASVENEFLLRSAEVATIVPMPMTFGQFADNKTNLLIELQDVQFNKNEATGDNRLTYASEPFDQFDGERTLESCISSTGVVFSTSTFADFKSLLLPSGRGSMTAILTKNFFGDDFNIVVSSPEDIVFDTTERCDPGEIIVSPTPVDCDDDPIVGGTTLYSEDFESYNNPDDLVAAGWTLVNASGGSYTWGIDDFSGNTYAIGNAFNTDEQNIDTWLISPEINLDGTTEEVLNFDIQTNFNGGEVMSVYVSSDFTDASEDSNWSLLADVTIPDGPSNGFGSFLPAGPVNLSCVSGTVRLGFRYTGSDPGITTRYHVDDIVISGN